MRIKKYYYSNQPSNKLQILCSLGTTATCTTIVFVLYWF